MSEPRLAELNPAALLGLGPNTPPLRACLEGPPIVRHGAPERITALRELPALADVTALVERFRDRPELVQTWFPPGDLRFTHWGRMHEALDHYRGHARLQFNQVEQQIPELYVLLARCETELGLAPGSATATVIASTSGAMTEPHFDNYPAITFQLQGEKRWRIGGKACPNTLDSVVLNDVEARARVARFWPGELPTTLTDDAAVHELRPGSTLLLPRGYVHHVESGSDTLSLAIDLVIPMWTELVLRQLGALLQRRIAWRDFAVGLAGDAERRAALARELDVRLRELPAVLDELASDPEAMIAAPRLRRYRHDERATLRLDASDDLLRVEHPERGPAEIGICPDLEPLSRWLVDHGGTLDIAEAQAAAAGALPANVAALLAALVETGALEEIDDDRS